MRFGHVFAAAMALATLTAQAAAAETCSSRASQCDQICAARPNARPFNSPYDRCAESCQPRWNQCLRTGIWVHLEDGQPGWRERVDRFFCPAPGVAGPAPHRWRGGSLRARRSRQGCGCSAS